VSTDGDEQKAVAGSTGSVPAARSDGARVETDHVSKAGALKDAPVLAVFTGLWRPPRAMKDRLRAAVCCRSWCARAL